MSAKIAEWMIGLEEQPLERADDAEAQHYANKNKRTFGEQVVLDVQERRASVRCRQIISGGGTVEKSTVICW